MPPLGGGIEPGFTPGDRGRQDGHHDHGEGSQRRCAAVAEDHGVLLRVRKSDAG
jgi:hypothetical protein